MEKEVKLIFALLFTVSVNAYAANAKWSDAKLKTFTNEIKAMADQGKKSDDIIAAMNAKHGKYFSGESRQGNTIDYTVTYRNIKKEITQYWVLYSAPRQEK